MSRRAMDWAPSGICVPLGTTWVRVKASCTVTVRLDRRLKSAFTPWGRASSGTVRVRVEVPFWGMDTVCRLPLRVTPPRSV